MPKAYLGHSMHFLKRRLVQWLMFFLAPCNASKMSRLGVVSILINFIKMCVILKLHDWWTGFMVGINGLLEYSAAIIALCRSWRYWTNCYYRYMEGNSMGTCYKVRDTLLILNLPSKVQVQCIINRLPPWLYTSSLWSQSVWPNIINRIRENC